MKTLKDLEKSELEHSVCDDTFFYDYVCTHCLRRAAIEWIKEFNTFNECDIDPYPPKELEQFIESGSGEYTDGRFNNIIRWMIEFLNISKEDLK